MISIVILEPLETVESNDLEHVSEREETDHLIEVLPVVLRHQAECTEQREAEIVKACVAVVRVWTDPDTCVVDRTSAERFRRKHKNKQAVKII